ncbi:Transcriptional regulator, partial [Dysosmobacter welbionis]
TWGIIRLPYADPVNPQDVVSNWNADIQPLRCCHSGICRRFIRINTGGDAINNHPQYSQGQQSLSAQHHCQHHRRPA